MPACGIAPVPEFDEVCAGRAADDERFLARDVAPLHTDRDLLWALRVALPDVVYATDTDEDGVTCGFATTPDRGRWRPRCPTAGSARVKAVRGAVSRVRPSAVW